MACGCEAPASSPAAWWWRCNRPSANPAVVCVECREHGVRVEQVPWAAHDSHFTRELEEMVAWLAQRMDKSATCRLMAINWRRTAGP